AIGRRGEREGERVVVTRPREVTRRTRDPGRAPVEPRRLGRLARRESLADRLAPLADRRQVGTEEDRALSLRGEVVGARARGARSLEAGVELSRLVGERGGVGPDRPEPPLGARGQLPRLEPLHVERERESVEAELAKAEEEPLDGRKEVGIAGSRDARLREGGEDASSEGDPLGASRPTAETRPRRGEVDPRDPCPGQERAGLLEGEGRLVVERVLLALVLRPIGEDEARVAEVAPADRE